MTEFKLMDTVYKSNNPDKKGIIIEKGKTYNYGSGFHCSCFDYTEDGYKIGYNINYLKSIFEHYKQQHEENGQIDVFTIIWHGDKEESKEYLKNDKLMFPITGGMMIGDISLLKENKEK